jgi:thioredoxin 2
MEIIFACPHCKHLNRLPKKDSYKKAICGACKGDLLDNKPIELDDFNEFSKIINSVNVLVVVDFWAQWCGPCVMFAPTFQEVAKMYPLKVQFAKVNVDINQQAASMFGIRSIPTIVALKEAKEIDRVMGALPQPQFALWVDNLANS